MAIEFLFRYGGLKGVEIAQIMGIDYSTASKERKLMRERLEKDAGLRREFKRIESKLSKVKPVRFYTGLYTTCEKVEYYFGYILTLLHGTF